MAAGWPQPDADRALRAATFRLVTPSGGFAGTGFLADGDGGLLTCHHVAAPHAALKAVDQAGQTWDATPEGLDDPVLAAADMAVVRLAAPPPAAPLPLVKREPGDAFASRVQLADAQAFRDSTPLAGALLGPASISYRHNGRDYRVDGRAVVDARVLPGMSGAAIWDPHAAAVVGVLAVSAANDPNLGGFAIPFARAAESEHLARLLAASEITTPRYGDRPNRLGLVQLLRAGTEDTLDRLRARGIVTAVAHVRREGFEEKLGEFLASDGTTMAIVSAAGQGKTNLLIQVLEHAPHRPAWLIRAADLGSEDAPVQGLNRLLAAAGAPAGLVWPGMAASCDLAPILLLDGLNEAPIGEQRIANEWLPDLIVAARTGGWRVIYTTRRDLFTALSGESRTTAFTLGRYTREEAEAAAEAYGLSGRILEREPLLLRVRAEVSGGARRSQVLHMFVERLLRPTLQDGGRHPVALLDDLSALAVRAAAAVEGESAVAPRDDPFFLDRPLTAALRAANLLEVVPAGYRFVFDEVADYLHARDVARRLRTDPGAAAGSSPNVVALALEILVDEGLESLSVSLAEDLGRSISAADPARALAAFAALSALTPALRFLEPQLTAARALAQDDELVGRLMYQPDLLEGLPPPVIAPIARAAVLLEEGYGWREKEVHSVANRRATLFAARTQFGVKRIVVDLIEDTEADGVGVLIDWLSDSTRLAYHGEKYASSEGSVGSFALCMLFAHRERVGLQRLFDDVLQAERPGWQSLMDGLAEEDTEAFMAWLEAIPAAAASERPAWILTLWRKALQVLGPEEGGRRASAAITALMPHLDAGGAALMLDTIIGDHLSVPDVPGLVRRAAGAGALDRYGYTLASAYRNGIVELDEALALATDRDQLIWNVAYNLKAGRPPLATLMPLLRQTRDWSRDLLDHRTDFENLLYVVGLAEADAAGLCAAIDELLAAGTETLRVMSYVAFTEGPCSAEQGAFRIWLAHRLMPHLDGGRRQVALEDLGRMSDEAFERYREAASTLAAQVEGEDLIQVFAGSVSPRPANIAFLFAAWLASHPDDARHAAMMRDLRDRLLTEDLDTVQALARDYMLAD